MSLPISNILQVGISLSPTAAGLAAFGPLLFLSSSADGTITPDERVRTYTGLNAVQSDFPLATDEVAIAAATYFAQSPTPLTFKVGLVAESVAQFATLKGGTTHASLAILNEVTAGTLSLTIDGDANALTLDFSAAADFPEVADVIDTALAGIAVPLGSCAYENGRFVITSLTSGILSTISVATGDTAASLNLDSNTAVVEDGADSESVATAYLACHDADAAYYGVALDKKYREVAGKADTIAPFAAGYGKAFFNTSNDVAAKSTGGSGIMGQLKNTSSRLLTMYSSHTAEYPCVAFAGRAFTVNFEGRDTTITMNLKRLNNVTPEKLSSTEAGHILAKNGNVYTTFGGRPALSDGRMSDASWFDSIHGTDWLSDRIQKDAFNLLYQSGKIGFTDTGVGKAVQRVDGALRQAVVNGLIAPGDNAAGDYLEQGYKIYAVPVEDVGPSIKGSRVYSGITFEAAGAGALHGLVISGSFNE